jgi:hypothetical protein
MAAVPLQRGKRLGIPIEVEFADAENPAWVRRNTCGNTPSKGELTQVARILDTFDRGANPAYVV